MSIQKKAEYSSYQISERDVVEYLENKTDFFERHIDTLLKMKIEHASGDAVSILEYQNTRLRNDNRLYKEKLNKLVSVARENDRLHERIHHLTLALIDASSLDDSIEVINHIYKKDFHAQWVNLYLFKQATEINSQRFREQIIPRDDSLTQLFESFFKTNRPLCGRLKQIQLEMLFRDDADQVGSSVLIPLGGSELFGMLAIGSSDHDRFQSSMGTQYLNQMSDLISHAIKRFL